MKWRTAAAGIAAAAMALPAFPFPDGAPWGSANPQNADHCANCHFDGDPVRDSQAVMLDGIPAQPAAGQTYRLSVTVADPAAVVIGFQLVAIGRGGGSGYLTSETTGVETAGSAARSTMPLAATRAEWFLEWRAPGDAATVEFLLAATAANHDGSPFGDRVHYRSYVVDVE